jgi:RimJ/RimL family protein N-acetyltransferase
MSALPPLLHRGRSLSLRRTAPADAPLLFDKMYRSAAFMHLFRLNDPVDSEAQLRERLAQRLKSTPTQSGYLELLMQHQQHGSLGVVCLADYSALHRRAEFLIGIFDQQHRRASYALEACLLIGDLAFNYYNLHRVYAYSYEYNHYAQNLMCTGGFHQEGSMKSHVFDRDTQQYVDLNIYGLNVNQFRQNPLLARLSRRLVGRDITQPPPPAETPLETTPAQQPTYLKSGSNLINRTKI